MSYDIYSRRTSRTKWLQIEQYNEISEPLRIQIVSILELIVEYQEWEHLWHGFCNEGKKHRSERDISYNCDAPNDCEDAYNEYQSRCCGQIDEGTIEDIFDMTDIAFQLTHKTIQDRQISAEEHRNKELAYEKAVKEINIRFEEARVGYRLVNNRIERNFLSLDMALPALNLLRGEDFKHARDNFYNAHRDYQDGKYNVCVYNANASFESLLKALCKQEELSYDSEGKIGDLVKILCDHLFPKDKFNKNIFESLGLLQTLKLSPTTRAYYGAHGFDPRDEKTPAYMARYALHLAATNILFFTQAVEAKDKSTEPEENSSDLDDDIPF